MTEAYKYKAFISYSHRDKAHADKLFRALESYRVPRRLVGVRSEKGDTIRSHVGHLFRDRDELPAAEDLNAEVKKALTQSEFMIVLCSPAAAASRWVNREIIEFKKLTGERRILSVILTGEPFASDHGHPENECFPPALRYKLSEDGVITQHRAEPLAADLRPEGDGERRGLLKLVAGLMGIGLDALIERDLQRKMRRVMAVTATSVAAMVGMGLLTYEAVTARQEAERHRGEAEGLIEFMLTDLRDKLEPVGRLDVLDAVGEQAVSYYDRQALTDMPDDALGRRARAFHLLGEIDDKQGDFDGAQEKFQAAYLATEAQLGQDPGNPQRIFDHSQSAFWVGYAERVSGDNDAALTMMQEYALLARRLTELEERDEWQLEYAYSESNLGTLLLRQMRAPQQAIGHLRIALDIFDQLATKNPDDEGLLWEVADAHAWVADAEKASFNFAEAKKNRLDQLNILTKLRGSQPDNWILLRDMSTASLGMGRIERSKLNWQEAVAHFEDAALLAREFTNHDPANVGWRELSAITHLFWSNALVHEGNLEEAQKQLEHAKALETGIFQTGTPTELQKWEIQAWREVVETKLLRAQGQVELASAKAAELLDKLTLLNASGVTPWKEIPLKDELNAILNEKQAH